MVVAEVGALQELSSDHIAEGKLGDGTPLPPIPVPKSVLDQPPKFSDRIVVATNPTEKLLLWWDYDHGDIQFWIPNVVGAQFGGLPGSTINYFYGPPIPDYTLTYRRYWQQLDYQAMGAGTSYNAVEQITHGVSTTDSQSLSAELGVEGAGLSAKLTATFEHSVTIADETTVTKTWAVDAAPANTVNVWVFWQLVEEFVALGSNGLAVGGWPYGTCGANIGWMMAPDMNGDTSMPTATVAEPTTAYFQSTTPFPAP